MAPIIEQIESIKRRQKPGQPEDPFTLLEGELHAALTLYWSAAARILDGSGIQLVQPEAEEFALRKHFFSAIFLYSYHRAHISAPHRILYAAVNQCLRGMITGSDNLLDDEYRKTLETDIPTRGKRFRSIMDIMVSDRVLFEILFTRHRKGDITAPQLLAATAASLRALARIGAHEAAEEGGVVDILPPARILETVHRFKTGLLFQSPWAIPLILEGMEPDSVSDLLTALYRIGLGCQIMDDMVDLEDDLKGRRHNYVASLVYHDLGDGPWQRLMRAAERTFDQRSPDELLRLVPEARTAAGRLARNSLNEGFRMLFLTDHHYLVEPAIMFLTRRIGAEGAMAEIG